MPDWDPDKDPIRTITFTLPSSLRRWIKKEAARRDMSTSALITYLIYREKLRMRMHWQERKKKGSSELHREE